MRCQLTGDAANLLWAQPNADDVTYEELERMLRGRFGSADLEEKFQSELSARWRGARRVAAGVTRGHHPTHGAGIS